MYRSHFIGVPQLALISKLLVCLRTDSLKCANLDLYKGALKCISAAIYFASFETLSIDSSDRIEYSPPSQSSFKKSI